MNATPWITHFETNHQKTCSFTLPGKACELTEPTRYAVAESVAIFQLGETGGGTRLRQYVRATAPALSLPGYQRAIDLFVAEEQGHAALLLRLLHHLRGTQLTKQWTNSIFRWIRGLVNLEFNIQVLVTAEIIAEVYFGMLYLHCQDEAVRAVAQKILRDEMKHLSFQRDFLATRLTELSPGWRRLWRWQFNVILYPTAAVVAWDHGACINALGMKRTIFAQRCVQAGQRFLDRLETLSLQRGAPAETIEASKEVELSRLAHL
jgi:hypothetical protein